MEFIKSSDDDKYSLNPTGIGDYLSGLLDCENFSPTELDKKFLSFLTRKSIGDLQDNLYRNTNAKDKIGELKFKGEIRIKNFINSGFNILNFILMILIEKLSKNIDYVKNERDRGYWFKDWLEENKKDIKTQMKEIGEDIKKKAKKDQKDRLKKIKNKERKQKSEVINPITYGEDDSVPEFLERIKYELTFLSKSFQNEYTLLERMENTEVFL